MNFLKSLCLLSIVFISILNNQTTHAAHNLLEPNPTINSGLKRRLSPSERPKDPRNSDIQLSFDPSWRATKLDLHQAPPFAEACPLTNLCKRDSNWVKQLKALYRLLNIEPFFNTDRRSHLKKLGDPICHTLHDGPCDLEKALFTSIRSNQIKSLEALLFAGAPVNAMDQNGLGLLHYAAFYGDLDAVILLLKYGADNDTISANLKFPWEMLGHPGRPAKYRASFIEREELHVLMDHETDSKILELLTNKPIFKPLCPVFEPLSPEPITKYLI